MYLADEEFKKGESLGLNLKTGVVLERALSYLNVGNVGAGRALFDPVEQLIKRIRVSFGFEINAAIGLVSNPTLDTKAFSFFLGAGTKENPLNPTVDSNSKMQRIHAEDYFSKRDKVAGSIL